MSNEPTTPTAPAPVETDDTDPEVARLRAEHLAGLRELQAGRDRVVARLARWTQPIAAPRAPKEQP